MKKIITNINNITIKNLIKTIIFENKRYTLVRRAKMKISE